MSDSDKTLKLLIEVDKTGSGGVAAAGELESAAAAANKGRDASHDLGKETDSTTKKFRLFSGEGREMHHVISEVTRISPLLGEALRVAIHPVGGTIAAAIGLFVLMKEHISEVEKELDAMGEKAAEPLFLEGIRAKQAVLREAADAAAEYAQHLDDIASGEHNVTAELTAQLALQKSITEARAAQASAEEALALAKIHADVARGKLTPAEGDAAVAAEKAKAITDAAKAKQDAEDKEVATKTAALASLDVSGDQANAVALTQTYTNEKARRARNEKDFGDAAYDKKNNDDNVAVAAAQKKYDAAGGSDLVRLENELRTNNNEFQRENLREEINEIKTKPAFVQASNNLSAAQNIQSQNNSGRRQYLADMTSEPEFNALKIATDAAVKKADETTTAQKNLTDQLKALTDAILTNRPTENATAKSRQDAVFYDEVAELGKGVPKAKEFDQRLASGQVTLQEAHTALAEAQAHTRALIQAVKDSAKAHSAAVPLLIAELNSMRQETLLLAQQIRASGFNTK